MAELARFISGNSVTAVLSFDGIRAVTCKWSLVDQAGNVIIEEQLVEPKFDDTEIVILIDDRYNELAKGSTKELRHIALAFEDEKGSQYTKNYRYAVMASVDLAVPDESLLTIGEAELASIDLPNIDGYEEAGEFERRRALLEASRRISSIKLSPAKSSGSDFDDFDWGESSIYLTELSRGAYYSLPSTFLRDVRLATLAEADDILGGNPIEQARRDGILSESCGETTNMYQSGRPAEERLGTRAYRLLSKYILRTYKVSR